MADFNNPYAPPTTLVADAVLSDGVGFQPVKILGTQGRIGRLRYAAYMLGANLILGFAILTIVLVLGVLLNLSIAASRASGVPREEILAMVSVVGVVVWVILGISAVLSFVFYILISIQRSHDLNLSGWAVLLTFIPLVGLYWLFKSGTEGANRFGPPPPPNSTGVKVSFWISVFLTAAVFLFSVIAVFAAIPAYQDYMKRAQAARSQQLQDYVKRAQATPSQQPQR